MSENNNAVVPARPAGQIALNNLQDILTLGEVLAKSGMFETARTAAQAVVKIMTGRELGFGPMASLVDIHFFDGKPTVGAHLRAAAIKRSGRYDYRVVRCDREACELEFLERRGERWETVGKVAMTLQEAVERGYAWSKKGGCLKENWKSSSDDMLFARCISKGYRRHCPDLSAGLLCYDPDEMDGEPIDVTPPAREHVTGSAEGDARVTAGVGYQGLTELQAWKEGEGRPAPTANGEGPRPNPPAPAPTQEAGDLTEQDGQELTQIIRANNRPIPEVNAILKVLGVPVMRKVPRDRLPWLKQALAEGLAPQKDTDAVASTVTELGLNWDRFRERLTANYGRSSLGQLLPSELAKVRASLESLKAQRAAQQPQPAVT